MKLTRLSLFFLVGALAFSLRVAAIGGPTHRLAALTEEQKIDLLIAYVEKSNAIFIRNGSPNSAADAAKHLRMKREKAGKKIKTAREFIDHIASKSSMTGEPYQMKFSNGTILPVRDVLYYELKKIETPKVGFNPGLKAKSLQACSVG